MIAAIIYLLAILFFALGTFVGIFHLRKYRIPGDLSSIALGIYLVGTLGLITITFLLTFVV